MSVWQSRWTEYLSGKEGGGVFDACFSFLLPPWDLPLPSISLMPYLHISLLLSLHHFLSSFLSPVLLSQRDLLVQSGSSFTELGERERERRRGGGSGEGEGKENGSKNNPPGAESVDDLCVDIPPHVFGHHSN